jgi:hypothetical protein
VKEAMREVGGMQVQPQPMTGRQRALLVTKAEQARESADAALLTAAVLVVAIIVGLRLIHASVLATVLLAVPMLASGLVAYGYCRRRRQALEQDLNAGTVLTASGPTALVRLQGKAEGSFLVRLQGYRLAAIHRFASLRSLMVRPEPGTFSGDVAFVPRSGQILALTDRSGRSIFDAHEREILDDYEEEFSRAS